MSARTPAGNALSQTVIRIFRVYGLLQQAGERMSAPARQSTARWKVMGAVDPDPRSVADIARNMGMARQSVQRIADELVADRMALYRENPDHQRAKLLQLTPQGAKALEVIQREQVLWANQVGGNMGEAKLKRLGRDLEELIRELEKEEKI